MNVVAALIANREPAILRKPGQCALHSLPVPPQLLAALLALYCYPALDGTLSQSFFALFVVVGFVGVKLPRALSRSAAGSLERLYGDYQLLENHRIVDVGCTKHHRRRDASSVRNKVALGARFSSIRRILCGFCAPFWPGWKPSPNKRAPTLSGRLGQDDPKAFGADAPIRLPLATRVIAAST